MSDRHFSDTYYRPSWHGGDVQRPLCHRKRLGFIQLAALTTDPRAVTCNKCRARLALSPVPLAPATRPPLPVQAPVGKNLGITRTEIARTVAEAHGMTVEILRLRTNKRHIAWPRQEAMARMIFAGFSTTAAGAYFDRDHTTAIHAVRAVTKRMAETRGEAA